MMKKLLTTLALWGALASPLLAQSQTQLCQPTTLGTCVPVNANGPLYVTGTITATSAATATAAAPSYPEGTSNSLSQNLTGDLRVIAKQSTSPWIVAGGGTAGTAASAVLTVQGIASMTPLLATVTNAGTFVTQSTITAASGSFASGSQSIGITPTDRTITSATGASQTVMALNATRKQLVIQNIGTSNCGINPTGGTAVIGGAGTITLVPNGTYNPHIPTLSAVTAICTSTQPLYAEES